jgi:hypothetical protein
MKIKFLGVGNFFTMSNFHSNMLLETKGCKLLIDCGTDIRFSLRDAGESVNDIDAVYISHVHADHAGGLEWLAYARYFMPSLKGRPFLYAHPSVLALIRTQMGAAMALRGLKTSLETFFDVRPLVGAGHCFGDDVRLEPIQTFHYYDNHELMPSFGLLVSEEVSVSGKTAVKRVFISTDSNLLYPDPYPHLCYEVPELILHDCETYGWRTGKKSGAHAHYCDLVKLPPEIKKKMWLYHYGDGELPPNDGFAGYAAKGQVFEV